MSPLRAPFQKDGAGPYAILGPPPFFHLTSRGGGECWKGTLHPKGAEWLLARQWGVLLGCHRGGGHCWRGRQLFFPHSQNVVLPSQTHPPLTPLGGEGLK